MNYSEEKIWEKFKNPAIFTCILLGILFNFFPQDLDGYFLGGAILFTAVFGLPHGALDFKLLQSLWKKKQLPYLLTYFLRRTFYIYRCYVECLRHGNVSHFSTYVSVSFRRRLPR